VILKIIKHCKDFSPALVTKQLLGLDVGNVLEVTNCFSFPVCKSLQPFIFIQLQRT
ncbi:translation initiation factor 3 subunit H1, partial [Perilla frutescens var. frutescens]